MSKATRSAQHSPSRSGTTRIVAGTAGALALIGLTVATAGATTRPQTAAQATSHTSAPVVVSSARRGSLGAILVNSKGFTLYHYAPDKGTKIACQSGCDQAWPPLVLPKGVTHATAGTGVVRALLGTVKRPGGTLQVTYRGLTLYRYVGDTKAGQTTGNSVPNWHSVALKASSAPTTTTTGAGGYGY